MLKPVLAALAALSLTACAALSPFAVNPKLDPDAQKVQAEAKAEIDKALAARLDHCEFHGQIGAGLGGLAGSGTGLSTTGSFDCLARPWDVPPATP